MNLTRWVLLLALLATLAAAWLAPAPEEPSDISLSASAREKVSRQALRVTDASGKTGPATSRKDGSGTPAGPEETEVLLIRARVDSTDVDPLSDLFALPQWDQRAPPVPNNVDTLKSQKTEAAALVPTAPPLPFTVMGSMHEGPGKVFFLRYGGQSFVIRVGDTLLEQYRVEAIEGDKLILRYLPLNQLQSLELGTTS